MGEAFPQKVRFARESVLFCAPCHFNRRDVVTNGVKAQHAATATTLAPWLKSLGTLDYLFASRIHAMAASSRMLCSLVLAVASLAEDATPALRGKPEAPSPAEMPEVNGLPDTPGPYKQVPNDTDAQQPKQAMPEWRSKVGNATQGSLGSLVPLQDWQDHQFCNVHQTGFFCDGSTRIRCCQLEDGYTKCGSTANSTACAPQAAQKALWFPTGGMGGMGGWGGGWHIHKGWHFSSFCTSHHVGRFCRAHHIIHCCNDFGHFVECNIAFTDSGRWC